MGKRKLYIISLDAFGADDLAFAKTLPHFQEIINRSALVKEVESVYPSLTYVAHTSIATGMYPNRHGVVHNTHLQPERQSPDWYWYAKEIKKATIFDVAKQAGYYGLRLAVAGDGQESLHRLQPGRNLPESPLANPSVGIRSCFQYALRIRDE